MSTPRHFSERLEIARTAINSDDFACAINVDPTKLRLSLKTFSAGTPYSNYSIPKKDGGLRKISVPSKHLKYLQVKIKDFIFEILENTTSRPPSVTHGTKTGTSLLTNGKVHVSQGHVINIDIKDFFPSIHGGRVVGFFQKDRRFLFSKKFAGILTFLTVYRNQLPQGAPSSPIIADLIAGSLDSAIMKIIKSQRIRYTRYIDDITLSTLKNDLPEIIGDYDGLDFCLSDKIKSAFYKSGFRINLDKTRYSFHSSKKTVTGLTVNTFPNANRSTQRLARQMHFSLLKNGYYHRDNKFYVGPQELDCLLGVHNFIYHLKRSEELRKDPKTKNDFDLSHVKHLSELMLYKHVCQNTTPIFLCEGGTDYLHISSALSALKINGLIDFNGSTRRLRTSELSLRTKTLLRLGQGASGLSSFLRNYPKYTARITRNIEPSPVFTIFDNDVAGRNEIKSINKYFGTNIDFRDPDLCTHVHENLYVCFLPRWKGTDTDIEGMYDFVEVLKYLNAEERLLVKNKSLGDMSKEQFALGPAKRFPSELFSNFIILLNAITETSGYYFDQETK